MTDFTDVGDFHAKFDLHHTDPEVPAPTGAEKNAELMEFRVKFLQEELDEFIAALATGDRAGMFDALLDLVYVALGTAHLLGFPWAAGWKRVQAANMAKVRAAKDGADSKRGSAFDVVKPPGWTAPDHTDLVADQCPGCKRRLDASPCRPFKGRLGTEEVEDLIFCDRHGRVYR